MRLKCAVVSERVPGMERVQKRDKEVVLKDSVLELPWRSSG